jgi:hypothetical protein
MEDIVARKARAGVMHLVRGNNDVSETGIVPEPAFL